MDDIPFGLSNDIFTAGDYTGDNGTDCCVFRPGNNTWYWGRNQTMPSTDFEVRQFGAAGDTPVWGDYDGDLLSDFALVRPSGGNYRWLILQSNFNYGFTLGCGTVAPTICGNGVVFGHTTDKLVPGDYDGDARTDIAIWRPSDGTWHTFRRSTATAGNSPGTTTSILSWGASGDVPQPADYDGDRTMDFAVFRPNPDPLQNFWFIRNSNGGTFTALEWRQQGDQPASSPYRIQ